MGGTMTQINMTFLKRDDWMRAVLAAKLSHATARVAITIALHLRVDTGQCNPGYPTIAAESRVSERSVYRHIELLERDGWIATKRAIGCANNFTLLTPANSMAGVSVQNWEVTPANSMAGDPCQNEGGPLPKRGGTPANGLAEQEQRKRRNSGRGAHTRAHTRETNGSESELFPTAENSLQCSAVDEPQGRPKKQGEQEGKKPQRHPATRPNGTVREARRARAIAPDWAPSAVDERFAKGQGLSPPEISVEGQQFRDHYLNGRPMKDWAAAWRTWIRQEVKFRQRRIAPRSSARSNDGII